MKRSASMPSGLATAGAPSGENISPPKAQNSGRKSVTTGLPGAARITYPYIFPPAAIFLAAVNTSVQVAGEDIRSRRSKNNWGLLTQGRAQYGSPALHTSQPP